MSVTIRQSLCPESRYGIKCPFTRTPTRIVIHNTANNAPAANEISYMLNRPEEVSFHYAVDDEEAVQGILNNRNAWASGDGQGAGNMYGIHIEICYSLSGGPRFTAAEKNAAWLTAYLLKQYGWGIGKVTKHQDYDGKYCPHRTLDLGWQRFLNLVKQELDALNKPEEEPELTKAEVKAIAKEAIEEYFEEQAKKPVSQWAQEEVDRARELGLMQGDADGKFRPQSFITRQEAAAVAVRAMERV